MKYIKKFESFSESSDTLIIVDVQPSFSKFFTQNYVTKLKEYCKNYREVYQIYDNHHEGTSVDKDYLYDENPDITTSKLYEFPNQKDVIEKRYNYDVDADFYKKILTDDVYQEIKSKEEKSLLKRGDLFNTTEGTIIVYIGNKHKWMHVGKKLIKFLRKLSGKVVTICGGSDNECLLDIETAAKSLGVKVKRDENYIYTATHCPIK
jgi:hypothetical protein